MRLTAEDQAIEDAAFAHLTGPPRPHHLFAADAWRTSESPHEAADQDDEHEKEKRAADMRLALTPHGDVKCAPPMHPALHHASSTASSSVDSHDASTLSPAEDTSATRRSGVRVPLAPQISKAGLTWSGRSSLFRLMVL